MKRLSALIGSMVCLFLVTVTVASAEEQKVVEPPPSSASAEEKSVVEPPAPDVSAEANNAKSAPRSNIEQLLYLLQDRNIISEEEAAAVLKQPETGKKQENINQLLNLLQAKGVISPEEAGNLAEEGISSAPAKKVAGPAGRNSVTMPLILPMDDRRFIQKLKDKWLEIGKGIDGFYPTFNDSRDPEYIIGRMKELEVITDDEAYELTREYRSRYLSGAVSATLENKEKTYLDRIAKNVAAELDSSILPKMRSDWTQRLKLSGDIRLRYEGDYFDEGNGLIGKPDKPSEPMNTTVDRTRFAIRARLGLEAKISDEFTAGIGLATGSASNPVSTNAAMGDSLNKKNFLVDRAYLRWSPDESLSVWGGRFPNPWFYSDLVWDPDINFEGFAVQYRPRLSSSWGLFFNAGAFPLQEVELSTKDKWLFGAQAGVEYQQKDKLTARLGIAFYDFENTVGVLNDTTVNTQGVTDWSAPQFLQKGNTMMFLDGMFNSNTKMAYAANYRELNITGTLDLAFWQPIHIVLLGDYVNNIGFDTSSVNGPSVYTVDGKEVKKETEGYQFGVSVGTQTVQNLWDWKALLNYKHLEADAVMDAFTDSDFHLGGTNAKGWIIGGDMGVAKNTWISTRWLTANQISGTPLSIDVFQLNINAKF